MPALRFDFLTEQTKPKKYRGQEQAESEVTYFVLKTKEVSARAWKDGGDFVVEAGSDAREKWVGTTTKDSTYGRLYEQLVSQGVIVETANGRTFHENFAFNSVSAAASVVTGRQTSGTGAWLLESDQTINFGAYERALAEQRDEGTVE